MKHDYDLSELEQIEVRGFVFNIMPRYRYHYIDHDYEKFSLDFLDRLVSEGSNVIDIGGHYGIYSLLSARKAKQVYAFEPVVENFKILEKNAHDNSLGNIQAINKAVSDSEGEVTFNVPWASDSAGFYEHPNAESIKKVKVQTASIDKELPGIKDVSFIKIDTEGHELHVLDGMQKTLRNNKRAKLLVEFNPECLHNAGAKPEDLIAKLHELNYDIFAMYEDTRHLLKVEADTPITRILGNRTYLNFLCLQKDTWLSVALVSHSTAIGGGELWLLDLVNGLAGMTKKFVLPYVTLPGEGPLNQRFADLPIAMQAISMRTWVNNTGVHPDELRHVHALDAEALARLTQLFEDFKPQVVLTNTTVMPWGALAAHSLGIPHVWAIHEFGELDHGFSFDYGYDQTLRWIDEYSQKVIVNSRAVQAHVGRIIARKKIKLWYQRINQPQLSSEPVERVFSPEAAVKLIIAAANVTPSKGQLEAVRAVHELRKKGVAAELAILGATHSADYQAEIEAYCAKHNLGPYVHFVGRKDNPHDYVNQADIALVCSRSEAFGRVTIEAMLLGKPVVGANAGATPELITAGKTGYLYRLGDPKDLAAHIQKSIAKPDNILQMGQAAKAYAQRFCQADYHELFDELLAASNANVAGVPMARDLLQGASLLLAIWQQREAALAAGHQKELADFSEKYNEVYAAYRKVEAQLAALQRRPTMAGRIKHKAKRALGRK
ncbi:MAG TPA: FkbM family methyltransferase [Nevskiaceae bacterium]|nr:FkbM family methyltransferase [Nevskiaceae bacterium]